MQDTDHGRSEFLRFVRTTILVDWQFELLSLSEVSLCDSKSDDPPITSVEVQCELLPTPGKHVATESVTPSEQSESLAAESDSRIEIFGNFELNSVHLSRIS